MRNTSAFRSTHRFARGASLIEVLVAMLIMTLGLMAMISLHTASVRYQKMSEFRSIATQLAENLGDRMRANIVGVQNNNYVRNVGWTNAQARVADPGIPCPAACTEAQFAGQAAASDIAQWINSAVGTLPGVGLMTAKPAGAPANATMMDVWVMWLDPSADADDVSADRTLTGAYACPAALGAVPTELRCLRYRFSL